MHKRTCLTCLHPNTMLKYTSEVDLLVQTAHMLSHAHALFFFITSGVNSEFYFNQLD